MAYELSDACELEYFSESEIAQSAISTSWSYSKCNLEDDGYVNATFCEPQPEVQRPVPKQRCQKKMKIETDESLSEVSSLESESTNRKHRFSKFNKFRAMGDFLLPFRKQNDFSDINYNVRHALHNFSLYY